MNYRDVLKAASDHLSSMDDQLMDVLDITKPEKIDYALHLAKIVSKLSPLVGNMIEYNVCSELNKLNWGDLGQWKRQDPGFPDTIFEGSLLPQPGIEVKCWFPLSTEITARFKDSVKFFEHDQTNVALVAWIPEFIIYGRPKIISVWVGTAKSIAESRDNHYHNPPDYLVFEPEDTSSRTSNLQQTNVNGYKFQGNKKEFETAKRIVSEWSLSHKDDYYTSAYQQKLQGLFGKFKYRLDTNFAKIDRIRHDGIEDFKTKVLNTEIHNQTIKEWSKIIGDPSKNLIGLLEDLI